LEVRSISFLHIFAGKEYDLLAEEGLSSAKPEVEDPEVAEQQ